MRTYSKFLALLSLVMFLACMSYSQDPVPKKTDYQIYLSKPAKQIRLLMYEKNYEPIQGKLSEDKKSIIIKDYESGSKVHVKVEYEDGTTEEFVKSPCYIDPVVT